MYGLKFNFSSLVFDGYTHMIVRGTHLHGLTIGYKYFPYNRLLSYKTLLYNSYNLKDTPTKFFARITLSILKLCGENYAYWTTIVYSSSTHDCSKTGFSALTTSISKLGIRNFVKQLHTRDKIFTAKLIGIGWL